MNDLIAGLINADQMLEIAFSPKEGTIEVFRGQLISSDSNALAVRTENGHIRLLRISAVSYLDILPIATSAADVDSISSEETMSDDAQHTITAGANLFSNTPVLATPKVIGHIELHNMGDTTRFRRGNDQQESPIGKRPGDDRQIPGLGRISRLGPNFGFIQPNDPEAASVFLPRSEILSIHGLIKSPNVGDEVIYTAVTNRQGHAAKCVHLACSLATLEEMADRLSTYDPRNASIIRSRIKAVNEGTPLEEVPFEFHQRRPRPLITPAPALDASTVLAMVARGEEVTTRDITECENRLSELLAETDYPNYIKALDRLLGYSMKRNMTVVHRLFSRAIRVARATGDTDTALRFVRTACDFYRHQPGNYKFFSNIEYRLTHPVMQNEEDEEFDNEEDEDITGTGEYNMASDSDITESVNEIPEHTDDPTATDQQVLPDRSDDTTETEESEDNSLITI